MGIELYDKYGGFAAISPIVHDFYDRVLASDVLQGYFDGVDMEGLISHQTQFLCKVLGGPDNYSGRSLKAAHRNLQITSEAFGEVARCLNEALTEAGVEKDDIETIMNAVASTRADVVEA